MTSWTLITGASEGLGQEFARLAARDGHNIILTARSEDKLTALAQDLRADGTNVEVISADLTDPDDLQRLWDEASKDRTIDVLVNNAGLGRHGDFGNGADWEREEASIAVNVAALTYLMKRAIPPMRDHGKGRILNVASVAAYLPGPNMAVYHATKAYVLSLSLAVAEELSGSGVTVTALCPGATATSFFDSADMHGVRLLKLAPPASAAKVAELGWSRARVGARSFVPGAMNKLMAFSARLLPARLQTMVSKQVMAKG